MRRREFIAGLGGTAAQQSQRMPRVSVLMAFGETDPEARTYLSEFTQGLAKLGWADGSNLRIDVRWGAGNVERIRLSAKELLDLQPDVIVTHGTPATAAFQRETRTIPIVFVGVADPVAGGIVARLDRPSGNVTGFAPKRSSTLLGATRELTVQLPRPREPPTPA